MDQPLKQRRPRRASLGVAALTLLLLAPLLMFLAASRDFTGLMSDTPTYVLLADFFSPYYPSADWFGFLVARYPFPPLYPIVLGLLGFADVKSLAGGYEAWSPQKPDT